MTTDLQKTPQAKWKLEILRGDCREVLKTIASNSIQCCVTSPPYWGLRDYGCAGQIGLEATPELYVETMREVLAEIWRVLRDDGTLWLNLGDSYASSGGKQPDDAEWRAAQVRAKERGYDVGGWGACKYKTQGAAGRAANTAVSGLKPKDLCGIPWRVAFALQADGWYLRSDIIWHKPNPMPESVTDRPTKSHEYLFLMSKKQRYYYDGAAIREPASPDLIKQVEEGYNGNSIKDYLKSNVQDASATKARIIDGARKRIAKQRGHVRPHDGFNNKWDALTPAEQGLLGSNKRSVWTVPTAPYSEAHFATFPPDLIKPCILAGCPIGGTVLDPFGGSGTTGMVALELGRKAVLIELNPDYCKLAERRGDVTPGLPFPE